MSREIRHVPLAFDWPLKKTWGGYLMPDDLCLPTCPDCDGRGYSPRARHLHDLWYGNAPFRPEDNGSTPLTPDTPAVRAFAERNVTRTPDYYGRGERAIVAEARRLAGMWNNQWSYHLNADDVAALLAAERLMDLTHTWSRESRWQPIDPPVTPTPEQVNEWAIRTFGHDAINASVCVRARAERECVDELCPTCGGSGDIATPEQNAAHEAWERTEPPAGDGWQLWETTSEGSPISPVFASGDDLAEWMSRNPCGFGGAPIALDDARRWVHGPGWAPSMVGGPGGIVDGITAMAARGE